MICMCIIDLINGVELYKIEKIMNLVESSSLDKQS